MNAAGLVGVLAGLLLAPLLQGVINRVKAFFAGRAGPPMLQPYRDLARLLRKGAVYSGTTTVIFRAAPVVNLAAAAAALLLLPLGPLPAALGFPGDLFAVTALLAAARFALVMGALDTGSSFEGMGASREVQFSALAEPALFLAFAVLARLAGADSLGPVVSGIGPDAWAAAAPVFALATIALFILLLAENARIPVDDPNTHLELTMIHEVMILDHSGPDLAFLLYAAALKLWLFAALLAGVVLPSLFASPWMDAAATVAGAFAVAVLVGVVESAMARLRLLRVPQLLVGAAAVCAIAFLVVALRM
jgi:formate hydrogenlyase subunit 4